MDSKLQQQAQQSQLYQPYIMAPTPQQLLHMQHSNSQSSIASPASNYHTSHAPQQQQQQSNLSYTVPHQPMPQPPPHHQFTATEHSFLDLLMNEREQAIKKKAPYHTWDGYVDQFQFEFHWGPDVKMIEAWNAEWEANLGFWWGLHPEKQLDIILPRRRCETGQRQWR
ncbi:hypothetical protein ONS95_007186 [Cadophora gregata]|uniref:uncharacterized protein n=1 Tax=Cadophora gregata TaxID=51156 RepID=UPI0026DCBC66|nr:uncharacterized protein ONS95_007186 [Cadophora gregata]KAK0100736.1 hypothetical protein ONS95_007186 [Cadophora gregata]KAK0117268.1 hypothetical protein ONS96_013101 [Cadophora gregata f. sp. sojae]